MGSKRLIFIPYNSKQIREIVYQRLSKCNIFDGPAMDYICKKVASVSSDIRKTLSICKLVIEKYKEDIILSISGKLNVEKVVSTFESLYTTPFCAYLTNSPEETKYMYLSLYQEHKLNQKSKFVAFENVFTRFCTLMITFFESPIEYTESELFAAFGILESNGSVAIKQNSIGNVKQVRLIPPLEEIAFGVRDLEAFQRMEDSEK